MDGWPILFAQETETTTVVTPGKNYVIDALITVIVFGAALFVICKASNRT